MSSDNFTPEESIRLIKSMIDKTRQNFSDQSHYFLLWGWSTLLALLGQFILKHIFNSPYHYMVWWVTIVCGIISAIWGRRDRRNMEVKTYVKENMGFLWTGLGITFFTFCLIFIKIGWNNCYPFFITLYGTGTFVSGKILQFKPLITVGIICWILAAISVWFNLDEQMLFAASAILISYIIPGHLLKQKYHRQ